VGVPKTKGARTGDKPGHEVVTKDGFQCLNWVEKKKRGEKKRKKGRGKKRCSGDQKVLTLEKVGGNVPGKDEKKRNTKEHITQQTDKEKGGETPSSINNTKG